MRLPALLLVLPLLALPAACGRSDEAESVEDKYERQEAAIRNRAEVYTAEAENAVGAEEARLENEAAAFHNQADRIEAEGENAAEAAEKTR
jgi:hypothetical protein